ncbi:hypothetical protein [Paenibacillus sp. 481]|uniref:hypothetical protein n=1 Tax=Paenibacillus sp. 481 TaxID=2835869 RepID=UPI001E511BA9|nr:hypothetical protein [Paenibacillus sp. 481]UHA74451.1 hypothetical protein KIK04_04910 [Paenibacillus sp. 481]
MTNIQSRFKNKYFILALSGFIYQLLSEWGVAPAVGIYQLGVDLLSYSLIGIGIYSTFDGNGGAKKDGPN